MRLLKMHWRTESLVNSKIVGGTNSPTVDVVKCFAASTSPSSESGSSSLSGGMVFYETLLVLLLFSTGALAGTIVAVTVGAIAAATAFGVVLVSCCIWKKVGFNYCCCRGCVIQQNHLL